MNGFVVRVFAAFLLCFLIIGNIRAGEDTVAKKNNNFWDKVYFGGNLSLQFGNYTLIDVSPLIGYKLTEKVSVGTGPIYIYFKDRAFNYSSSIYGGKLFGRYLFTPNLFGHTEYEVLNGHWDFFSGRRFNITNVWVGGGYRQIVGERSAFTIMALWNLNESAFSPYQNPLIRMGFSVGF